jgi:hypothetical protein
MKNSNKKYPCPCCGHLFFDAEPGTLEICKICMGQDDCISLKYPYEACGPNQVSLVVAQKNYVSFGASEMRLRNYVMKTRTEITEKMEVGWRPINLESDKFLASDSMARPDEYEMLYYWRNTYWLR